MYLCVKKYLAKVLSNFQHAFWMIVDNSAPWDFTEDEVAALDNERCSYEYLYHYLK